MNFAPQADDTEFRDRMRAIAEDYDWSAMRRMREEMQVRGIEKYSIEFYQRIAQEGLVGLSWPQPYGKGAPFIRAFLFAEELETQGFGGYGLTTNQRGGGMLIRSGTPEQIAEHVPRIVHGEWRFCQGLSEPGAGSDLLALKTRAVRDGDEYIINGAKLWTSNAHVSDWTGLLVRTNPDETRHRGLSMFLVDLKSPGVEIQPIWVMGGWRVNAVFYDNVRVPASNMIGDEGTGWEVVTGNLDEERAMSFGGTETRLLAARLIHRLEGKAEELSDSDLEQLGRFIMELEVDRLLYLRVGLAAGRGDDTSGVGPMSKVFGSELAQRFVQWAADVLGDEVLFAEAGEEGDVLAGDIEEQLRSATVLTNIGGTSEVQRNTISNRFLKLPRAY
ncbi:alkylation response protein AidB-like acyl-CoA dehydrogenase [Pseudomonas sp. JAI111]|uniref:acyl-CoA dehydrogenase family protein n=1 Tax=Pseudomonas sp. JAI111 TaxID=2735913 RepID=UPI0021672F17|nr:acyl-CoA dehydrogenase family protein [Pseudomonas sp. JAI111]MCS3835685.1 alkylation response protein AidB-like acyl-CoA dehydrogenase [Pseudomonas sp. JAI111]